MHNSQNQILFRLGLESSILYISTKEFQLQTMMVLNIRFPRWISTWIGFESPAKCFYSNASERYYGDNHLIKWNMYWTIPETFSILRTVGK